MRNKLILLGLLFLFSASSFAQEFSPQPLGGGPNVRNFARGVIKGDSGLVVRRVKDTFTANLNQRVKNEDGLVILVGDTLFIRDTLNHRWIGLKSSSLSGPSGTFTGIDSVTFNVVTQTICQWKQGNPTCYDLQADSVRKINDTTICIYKNGVADCLTVHGTTVVTQSAIDSTTYIGNLYCIWTHDINNDPVSMCVLIDNSGQGINGGYLGDDGKTYYFTRDGIYVFSLPTQIKKIYFGPGLTGSDTTINSDTSWIAIYLTANLFSSGLIQSFPVLNDTTITLIDTTLWSKLGFVFSDGSEPSFPITRAAIGNIRQDNIYINSSNVIVYEQGDEDTVIAATPVLPPGAIGIVSIVVTATSRVIGQSGATDSLNWRLKGNTYVNVDTPFLGTTNAKPVKVGASGQPLFILDPNVFTKFTAPIFMDTAIGRPLNSKFSNFIYFKGGNTGQLQGAIGMEVNGANGTMAFTSPTAYSFQGTTEIRTSVPQFRFLGNATVSYTSNNPYTISNAGNQTTGFTFQIEKRNQYNTARPLAKMEPSGDWVFQDSVESAPDPSSIGDWRSKTKGFLVPRMTAVEMNAISLPATGLLIFNTTSGTFYYYTGVSWTEVGSSGPPPTYTLDDVVGNGREVLNKIITVRPDPNSDNDSISLKPTGFYGPELLVKGGVPGLTARYSAFGITHTTNRYLFPQGIIDSVFTVPTTYRINGQYYAPDASTGVTDFGTIGATSTDVFGEQNTGSTSSTITIAHTAVTGTVRLYKNGIRLPASEYSVSGTTVTLTSSRITADIFLIDYKY